MNKLTVLAVDPSPLAALLRSSSVSTESSFVSCQPGASTTRTTNLFIRGPLGVEGGFNAPGLIPGSYTLGGYWRPFAYNTPAFDFRAGAGAQVFAFYNESFLPFSVPEGLAVLSAQATAAWKPLPELPFGVFAGARAGAGPAFSFVGKWIEPGILAEVQLGIVAF